MSKISEIDYHSYLKLIDGGLSQRAACRVLGLKRSTLQDYIKRKQKEMDCVKEEVMNGIIGNDYSNWITKEKPSIRFDVDVEKYSLPDIVNDHFVIKEKPLSKKPRILFYDIETSLAKSYHFQQWQVDLGVKQQIQEGHLLSHAWAWNDGDIVGSVLTPKEVLDRDPERLVLEAWSLLDNADVVVAHYGKRFDIPTLNGYFLKYGLPKPSPYKVIDTKQISSKNFKLPFNSLEYLAKALGVSLKIQNEGIQLWIDCDLGKQEALDTMLDYNIGDIASLRDIYNKLIGWDNNGVNMSLYDDTHDALCPHCASDNIKSLEGKYTYTTARKYSLYRCQDCGATLRSNCKEGSGNSLVRVV